MSSVRIGACVQDCLVDAFGNVNQLGYNRFAVDNIDVSIPSAVPEPSNVAMLTLGLAALAWRGRRLAISAKKG